jgi:hypothetical protein
MEYSRTYLTVLRFSFLPPVSSARPPDQAPGRVAEHNDRRGPTGTMRKVGSDPRTTCRQLQSSVAVTGRDEDTVTTAAHDGERFDAGRVGFGRQFVEPSANARAISAAAPRWPPPAVAARQRTRRGRATMTARAATMRFVSHGVALKICDPPLASIIRPQAYLERQPDEVVHIHLVWIGLAPRDPATEPVSIGLGTALSAD